MRNGWLIAVGGFLFAAARSAAAAPFALEYEAPASCPSREAFVEAIRARVPEAEESKEAQRYKFRVIIEPEGDRVRGSLAIGDGTAVRQVVPAPCADVANSMVLIIAIALTGERFTRLPGRSGAASAEDATATDATDETPPQPEKPPAPASVESKPASTPVKATSIRAERAPAPAGEGGSFRGGAWGAGGLADGVAPFPAIAVSGGAELALPWIGGLKPSARAGVMHASGDSSVAGFGGAEFTLFAFTARVCPHAFSLAQRWTLVACASLELGELTARGVRTPNRRVQRMSWTGFGVAPRVEFALNRFFSFEGELGLRAVVRHDRFVFEPGPTVVYDVPRLAPQLSLGVSARFP